MAPGLPDPCQALDPERWVAAFVTLTTVKGFYAGIGLICLFIVAKWPPWRCRHDRGKP